jgi:hypothetical protein
MIYGTCVAGWVGGWVSVWIPMLKLHLFFSCLPESKRRVCCCGLAFDFIGLAF